jgi:tetratricopeptide (TPR) repeat protein
MFTYQDSQAVLATESEWTDGGDLDAMVHALAADHAAPRQTEAGEHNERGMQLRRDGDLQGALQEFDAALRLNPMLPVVYNNRAVTRHELGDLDGALADLEEALRLDPNYADAYGNRAAVRLERGDAAGADADCRRALELAPDSASLHARRGGWLHNQKDWQAARAEYNHALRLDAGLHWVYLLRGNTYYHTGDWVALCNDYRRAFALAAPRCAGLLVRHLRTTLKADADAAWRAAEDHVQRDPGNAIAHAHRGVLCVLLRRNAEAEVSLARCRELCPESGPYLEEICRQARKQLQRCG